MRNPYCFSDHRPIIIRFWFAPALVANNSRITGCLAILPVLGLSVIWALGVFVGPTKKTLLRSPSGHFTARVQFDGGGATAKDYVSVSVRPSWSPIAEKVYERIFEPRTRWLDERTLEIRYPLQLDKTSCGGSWAGVKIVCIEISDDVKSYSQS